MSVKEATIPGPKGLPIVGVGLSFLKNPLNYFDNMVQRYGRVFRLPLGNFNYIFLNDAEDVEQVLRRDFENFGMSNLQEKLLEPLLGSSMPVVADHDYWKQLHSIMLPMFTPKMLQKYFVQTLAAVKEEADHLEANIASDKPVLMYDFARQGVFGGLTRTLFVRGIVKAEVPTLLDWFGKADEYVNARNLSGASPLINLLPKVREGKRCLDLINQRIYKLICDDDRAGRLPLRGTALAEARSRRNDGASAASVPSYHEQQPVAPRHHPGRRAS